MKNSEPHIIEGRNLVLAIRRRVEAEIEANVNEDDWYIVLDKIIADLQETSKGRLICNRE